MAILQIAASLAILSILYARLIRRKIPNPIKKGQAVILPILIHALYDAGTHNNRLLVFSIACITSLFVLQIIVPVKLKKNTEKYCGMKFHPLEIQG